MKKVILTIFISASISVCFSQTFMKKQIIIPLNNTTGVPFYKDDQTHDFVEDGFDIDSKENFYFLGGDKSTCLAEFSGNKQIYRKTYKEFSTAALYIYRNNLYTFDNSRNNLFVLKLIDGSLIKRYNHISAKHFNSYKFVDSSLVLEYLAGPDFTYEQFNLNGKYIGKVTGSYNIASNIIPEKGENPQCVFLGKWNDKYVFWDIVNSNNTQFEKFWLVDKLGNILATKILPNNNIIFGEDYYEAFPTEHRKVRNGKLYVLGRRGSSALITEVPLDSFFAK